MIQNHFIRRYSYSMTHGVAQVCLAIGTCLGLTGCDHGPDRASAYPPSLAPTSCPAKDAMGAENGEVSIITPTGWYLHIYADGGGAYGVRARRNEHAAFRVVIPPGTFAFDETRSRIEALPAADSTRGFREGVLVTVTLPRMANGDSKHTHETTLAQDLLGKAILAAPGPQELTQLLRTHAPFPAQGKKTE